MKLQSNEQELVNYENSEVLVLEANDQLIEQPQLLIGKCLWIYLCDF